MKTNLLFFWDKIKPIWHFYWGKGSFLQRVDHFSSTPQISARHQWNCKWFSPVQWRAEPVLKGFAVWIISFILILFQKWLTAFKTFTQSKYHWNIILLCKWTAQFFTYVLNIILITYTFTHHRHFQWSVSYKSSKNSWKSELQSFFSGSKSEFLKLGSKENIQVADFPSLYSQECDVSKKVFLRGL